MGARNYVTVAQLCEAVADGTLKSMYWSPGGGGGRYLVVPVSELRHLAGARGEGEMLLLRRGEQREQIGVAARGARRAGVGGARREARQPSAVGRR